MQLCGVWGTSLISSSPQHIDKDLAHQHHGAKVRDLGECKLGYFSERAAERELLSIRRAAVIVRGTRAVHIHNCSTRFGAPGAAMAPQLVGCRIGVVLHRVQHLRVYDSGGCSYASAFQSIMASQQVTSSNLHRLC